MAANPVSHKSCTVEMADLASTFDLAVIDECQLMGDPSRGWAWTNAFLGVKAKEIHICGSENVVSIVEALVRLTGDEIAERNVYQRLSPLDISRRAVENYGNIMPGDCVVAFRRSALYTIKREIERRNPELKCCVVYGGLPPETRRSQASLFSDPLSGFDVLVASDAIGMGLNLAIRRLIFSDVRKFDGRSRRKLSPAEIKQIAGRAGRFNVVAGNSAGEVTAMSADNLPTIRIALNSALPKIHKAGLFPSQEQLELIAVLTDFGVTRAVLEAFWLDKVEREWGGGESVGEVKLSATAIIRHFGSAAAFAREIELFLLSGSNSGGGGGGDGDVATQRATRSKRTGLASLLTSFRDNANIDESKENAFFLCNLDERVALAALLDDIRPPLSFRDKYVVSMAPVGRDEEELIASFVRLASDLASGSAVRLHSDGNGDGYGNERGAPTRSWRVPQTPEQVMRLEVQHKKFELYLWLCHRFPAVFPDAEEARKLASTCSDLISQALLSLGGDAARGSSKTRRRSAIQNDAKTKREKEKKHKAVGRNKR